jgi:predicted esterase
MDNFRFSTLRKIAANAGILTRFVATSLPAASSSAPKFQTLGSVGPGTSVMMPENPVKPDGSVDIVVNIRGIPGGDAKTAASLGVNAIVVTAEAGGLGSKENQARFGNANFINEAVSKVLGFLQQKFPDKNIHRGRLVVSGFSGGGGAIASLLTERNKIKGGVDGVVINDGLHANPGSPGMQAVLDYAKEAAQHPDKYKLNVIHTAVNPGKYISTTQTANYLLQQLGMSRNSYSGEWSGVGPKPVSEASKGGVKVVQLYDKEQPYMAKDPKTGVVRPNVLNETSGGQHISSLQWMPNAFQGILG